MAATRFGEIGELKRQAVGPVKTAFPIPMQRQMEQRRAPLNRVQMAPMKQFGMGTSMKRNRTLSATGRWKVKYPLPR